MHLQRASNLTGKGFLLIVAPISSKLRMKVTFYLDKLYGYNFPASLVRPNNRIHIICTIKLTKAYTKVNSYGLQDMDLLAHLYFSSTHLHGHILPPKLENNSVYIHPLLNQKITRCNSCWQLCSWFRTPELVWSLYTINMHPPIFCCCCCQTCLH